MGIYANIGNSDIQAGRSAKLPYLGEGDYEVILETIRKGERNLDGRDFFAIEFTIHKSNNANFETGTKATVLFVANKFPKMLRALWLRLLIRAMETLQRR